MSHPLLQWPRRHVAPVARLLDHDPAALERVLQQGAADGILGLQAPRSLGGQGLSRPDFTRWTIEAARASGTFAFLQTQHQSAVRLLSTVDSPTRRHVPALAAGALRCGISFGWLRRTGPPMVTATRVHGGYRIEGQVPWFTGHGFFHHCVSAARLPDQRIVFAFHRVDGPGSRASTPMATAAFAAARTVSIELTQTIPDEDIVAVFPPDWLQRSDPGRVVSQGALIVGTARAALDLLQAAAEDGRAPTAAVARAQQQLHTLEERVVHAATELPADGLTLRAQCIDHAGRLAHAAVAAWSGRSNSPDHPAQRVYREVLGFTVLSQTTAVRDATVDLLL